MTQTKWYWWRVLHFPEVKADVANRFEEATQYCTDLKNDPAGGPPHAMLTNKDGTKRCMIRVLGPTVFDRVIAVRRLESKPIPSVSIGYASLLYMHWKGQVTGHVLYHLQKIQNAGQCNGLRPLDVLCAVYRAFFPLEWCDPPSLLWKVCEEDVQYFGSVQNTLLAHAAAWSATSQWEEALQWMQSAYSVVSTYTPTCDPREDGQGNVVFVRRVVPRPPPTAERRRVVAATTPTIPNVGSRGIGVNVTNVTVLEDGSIRVSHEGGSILKCEGNAKTLHVAKRMIDFEEEDKRHRQQALLNHIKEPSSLQSTLSGKEMTTKDENANGRRDSQHHPHAFSAASATQKDLRIEPGGSTSTTNIPTVDPNVEDDPMVSYYAKKFKPPQYPTSKPTTQQQQQQPHTKMNVKTVVPQLRIELPSVPVRTLVPLLPTHLQGSHTTRRNPNNTNISSDHRSPHTARPVKSGRTAVVRSRYHVYDVPAQKDGLTLERVLLNRESSIMNGALPASMARKHVPTQIDIATFVYATCFGSVETDHNPSNSPPTSPMVGGGGGSVLNIEGKGSGSGGDVSPTMEYVPRRAKHKRET